MDWDGAYTVKSILGYTACFREKHKEGQIIDENGILVN